MIDEKVLEKSFDALFGSGKCKGCGEKIWWVFTKNGKRSPIRADGVSHFADCPKAGTFRRKKNATK